MLEIHSDSPKMGMGPQKSPVRCVWGNRNGLARRTVIPFAFADSYGPKDVRESLYWYPKSSKKFCETLKSDHSSPKGLILHHFTLKMGIKLQKMRSQMRFEAQQSIETSDDHPDWFFR